MNPPEQKATTRVTPDNFTRAETHRYFAAVVARGGIGAFSHERELVRVDEQVVVRSNRDTLYSSAVFDLDAGPVTITLPDAGSRFQSMMVIDEDEYSLPVMYGANSCTFTRRSIGTRYALAGVRTLVDPDDPEDVATVHRLQDAIHVDQPSGPGVFDVPRWDQPSQDKVRKALVALGETLPDLRNAFGQRDEVDPVRHLIGSAIGWGGNPDRDAIYLNVTPEQNDGTTLYRLSLKDVPVDAFWSVSVYNADGYFAKNQRDAYSLNSITAKRALDETVTIQFGNCADDTVNCLPIMNGWNYTVRLYRPRAALLNGSWTFPTATPAP